MMSTSTMCKSKLCMVQSSRTLCGSETCNELYCSLLVTTSFLKGEYNCHTMAVNRCEEQENKTQCCNTDRKRLQIKKNHSDRKLQIKAMKGQDRHSMTYVKVSFLKPLHTSTYTYTRVEPTTHQNTRKSFNVFM